MTSSDSPLVSIIIPCRNEEKTIGLLLEALAGQTYPSSRLEILVVDGLSADGAVARVQDFAARHPDLSVRVIENPRQVIPAALNLGITQAKGEYIIRMDAHAIPAQDYISHCLELLSTQMADNVGGRWVIVPGADTPLAQAIALAVSHPFGAGDALYRYGRHAAYVDTVPFGAFRRSLFDRVGLYDEGLLTNEDYDLNYRIRQNGGRIYFSPDIVTAYYARNSLLTLARQYFRYGWWKVRMLYKYPASIRWRQLVPPLFVAGLIGLGCGALIYPPAALMGGGLALCYVLSNGLVSSMITRRQRIGWRTAMALPLAFATIHLCWGLGFWASLPSTLFAGKIAPEDEWGLQRCRVRTSRVGIAAKEKSHHGHRGPHSEEQSRGN
jgi:succinoglycan biosynthesis protein ExoA